ncbi:unnamed protein product, partial [Musa hybrid cultivar]
PVGSFFSTTLITPTATVCLMSLTAKRPGRGYSEKVSTTMGLEGIILTKPASPFFEELWFLTGPPVDLGEKLSKLNSNVGGVA